MRDRDYCCSKALYKLHSALFSLKAEQDSVTVEQADELDGLQTLVMLDEALQQSDRYLEL